MKWNGGKGFSYTAVSTLVNVLVRSLGWGRADPPQSCSVDISGRSGSGSHGQGVSQRWGHTLLFSGSRRDNTTGDSTPHPWQTLCKVHTRLSWCDCHPPIYILKTEMQVLRPQPQGHREMGELCSALQHCWLRGPQAQSRTQRPRTRESCSQWGFQGNLLPEEGLSSDPAALTLCTPFTVKVYPQEPRVSSHHCGGNYAPWAPISLARTQRGRNKHREEEGACTQWSGQLQHVGAPRSSQELCVK